MTNSERLLLRKLGIVITELEYDQPELSPYDGSYGTVYADPKIGGSFKLDESRFRSMCHLIKITDMICESKNPAVAETFDHLVTLLELTNEE